MNKHMTIGIDMKKKPSPGPSKKKLGNIMKRIGQIAISNTAIAIIMCADFLSF